MILSRYLAGLFLFILLVLSLLLPRPSSAGPPLQEHDSPDPASTPEQPADESIDWANVELQEGRERYLPEGASPPPPETPSAPEERRPVPGDTEASPPESAPPPAAAEPDTSDPVSPQGGITYVVKEGDTVYALARQYSLTVADLAVANDLADPRVIYPGDTLVIPDASATTPEPAAAATPEPPEDENAYVVRSGDNPYRIARRFGVPVEALIKLNNITNPTRLKVGQVLIIPGPDVTAPPAPAPKEPQATIPPTAAADGTYVVRQGDTLYEISRRFDITMATLIAANDLADPRRLDVGQVLVIPDTELESASTPPPAPPTATAPPPTATAPPPTPVVEETPVPQDTGFIWPVEGGTISQYFRYGHGAIDILLPVGTPIVAAADGVIEFSGWNNYGYGWLIIVDHGNGFRTLYAHQSELLVDVDQKVKQGELIGKSGHTGYSTHPHLHFEIILNNVLKDPCSYLPGGC